MAVRGEDRIERASREPARDRRRHARAQAVGRPRAAHRAGARAITHLFGLDARAALGAELVVHPEKAADAEAGEHHVGTIERLIETLRARAARKEYTLTPGLFEAVALHFGNAEEARRAAGVPSPTDVRMAERRRAKAQLRATERARRRKRHE